MRRFDTYFATALLVMAISVALVSCQDSTISGGDFDEPLALTGVRYQSPDSTEAPQEINPGDMIALEGQNMNSVAHVYFNGFEAGFNPALASESHLVVTVPSNLPFGEMDPESETFNTIQVNNSSSEATMEFPVLPPAPEITGMSNEHAQPGTEVTLTGRFLYLIESITFPDGTTVNGDDTEAAADGSEVTFTVPGSVSIEEVTAAADGAISVTTVAGTGSSAPAAVFHDYRGMILDIESVQQWSWWSAMHPYDGSYDYQTPASNFRDGAEGEFIIVQPTQQLAEGDNAWWTSYRSINLTGDAEWVAPENLNEPAGNFALQFEMGIEGEWSAGTFQILLPETNHAFLYEPWRGGENSSNTTVSYDGWRTVTIPLSEFRTDAGSGNVASNLTALLGEDGVANTSANGDLPGFRFVNNINPPGPVPADLIFAFDRIRVVRIAE